MNCRHCSHPLELEFIDLGAAPPSNAYLSPDALNAEENTYPLVVMVCDRCWLVQTRDYAAADQLFRAEYAYFSSFSASWLEHSERYVTKMVERLELNSSSHVIEVASNDGYLLQYMMERGIPCLGVEPTASTAAAARMKGVETIEEFFGESVGRRLARTGKAADLTIANNVLAHVPSINDFVRGFAEVLKPDGVSTFEFPHFERLVQLVQFDTIYHEHFSYLSLTAVQRIFEMNGLQVFDVEEISTHGGSLRVYAQRRDCGRRAVDARVGALVAREAGSGMKSRAYYSQFQAQAERVKDDFVAFLIEAKRAGRRVGAYGAAAKGNTLMNFAGVRRDLIGFVVDRNPAKAGKFMPGSRIPIVSEDHLKLIRPDYVVILPWNLRDEIVKQLSYAQDWGARFVTAVPELRVFN